MFREGELGLRRFKSWRKLPDIAGTYDYFNQDPRDEEIAAFLYAYPKVDDSINRAVKDALISIDDITEITQQVFGHGRAEIQEYRQFFKNQVDQVILVQMRPLFDAQGDYEEFNCTYPRELYEELRPTISFFNTIDEAVEGSREVCTEVEHLPKDYFL